ncbi:Syntaxin-71 [Camellia lanceoleosa]|uniref:Syntaxin-71 n=1 Tax=Camellia lanceoleosa TaxID=1840588 RepID=A0ACC0G2V3_9ERIC|nr:Syntaxin-71 [Camellia lanceoleosa]
MSMIDLITRVETICKKYEKYDIDKQKEVNISGDDAFGRLYSVFDSDLDQALELESCNRRYDSEYFQQTKESNNFRNEYEMRKMKQDEGLDVIAEGLVTLKNMAHDINEILSICLGIWHLSIEKSNAMSTEETVQCPKSVLTSQSQVWIMLCVGSA